MGKALIANTLNRKKNKQQKRNLDKQRAIEFEEKYALQCQINKELNEKLLFLEQQCQSYAQCISRKESLYRDSISQLKGGEDEANGLKVSDCHRIHDEIMSHLEDKKYSTKAQMVENERSIICDYEQKQSELKLEVQRLKSKQMRGSDEWMQKIRKLEEENVDCQEITTKLQEENKKLECEKKASDEQMRALECDRDFLIKQVLSIKKENKHLHLLMLDHQQPKTDSIQTSKLRTKRRPRTAMTTNKQSNRHSINLEMEHLQKQLKNEKNANKKLKFKL